MHPYCVFDGPNGQIIGNKNVALSPIWKTELKKFLRHCVKAGRSGVVPELFHFLELVPGTKSSEVFHGVKVPNVSTSTCFTSSQDLDVKQLKMEKGKKEKED